MHDVNGGVIKLAKAKLVRSFSKLESVVAPYDWRIGAHRSFANQRFRPLFAMRIAR
jgi:uncharacterized protein YfdQ (DUF2303 family)